ncbi:phytoene desaturase family protein [Polyangium aurulentum]|uniref:phytoene desaturase family protein n=1 Tax=Polyangium aurulentum TaxID=2567896 RepID=UPI0010AE6723|nr:FAD-dependent oxidoreductase [Polyangium aurulentum]UQA61640.1 FAD-dependent oxidoreductase [Polyangium aurulentum]
MKASKQVVVIGGGLAGLAAATYAARAGAEVTLLEKASSPGGRAATHDKDGYALNLGPHALYQGGAAEEVLKELGVPAPGSSPPSGGAFALDRGNLCALPSGLVSLLTTSLLSLGGKIELARVLEGMSSLDPAEFASMSVAEFLDERLGSPEARGVMGALIRVSTYGDDFTRMSAGAAIEQVQLATRNNVRYVDGGWQTLVRGLALSAERAGASVMAGAKATSIERKDGRVRAVHLADGRTLAADAVVIAASPGLAHALLPDVPALAAWSNAAVPVMASCLDVALSHLPVPRNRFVLGIDRPLYFSVHSAVARLAPQGGAIIHVARYGSTEDPRETERELVALMDRVQPGWREFVVEKLFLPSMIVAHDLPAASRGGLAGRPGPRVPGAPGVFVAGDWVGPEGMLADASLASARAAARALAEVGAVEKPLESSVSAA